MSQLLFYFIFYFFETRLSYVSRWGRIKKYIQPCCGLNRVIAWNVVSCLSKIEYILYICRIYRDKPSQLTIMVKNKVYQLFCNNESEEIKWVEVCFGLCWMKQCEVTAPFSSTLRQPCCCRKPRPASLSLGGSAWAVGCYWTVWLFSLRAKHSYNPDSAVHPVYFLGDLPLFMPVYLQHFTQWGLLAAAEWVWVSL